MGYSNNKWRKILTILMIINLCFILFAKITKSFGAYSVENENENATINFPDWLDNYKFLFYSWEQNGKYNYRIMYSTNEITINRPTATSNLLTFYSSNYVDYQPQSSYNLTTYSDLVSHVANLKEIYNNTNQAFTRSDYSFFSTDRTNLFTYSNFNAVDSNGNVIYFNDKPLFNVPFSAPYFDNSTEIENGYPDGVFISRGDYSEVDPLYFHLLKITNTVPDGNQSTYYYDSKVFKLTKDSKYYKTYDADTENKYSYYYVSRSALTLDTNSSYLYVLSNSGDSISNSYGILQPDIPGGVYDVVQSDTAGVITEQQALNDKIANINNNQQDIANNSNNINNYLNENTISNDTNENIDTNLNFNNNAPQFSSLFNGFFSRLTSTISDLGNYKDTDVITVNLPIPFTNDTIPIKSDFIFSNQNNNFLRNITTLLWYFIFGRYFLYFLINTYWLITNGQFFNNYLTQKEVITGDML